MNKLTGDKKEKLNLPPLEYGPIKKALGHIHYIISEGGDVDVSSVDTIQVSPRRGERLYRLSNGQSIIVTGRLKCPRPENVDGVIQIGKDGKSKWLTHKLLEEFLIDVDVKGLNSIAQEIAESWKGRFSFHAEVKDEAGEIISKGLRPPQIGSLHAIGSYWSLYKQPATIVMPTGTGKTETMLATLAAYSPGKLLVIVPSKVLRDQTAKKFLTLGLLRKLNNLLSDAKNPIVGIIKKRPRSVADLDIFKDCNVAIATMNALGEASTFEFTQSIADRINVLVVDEAHHIGATSWSAFREKFKDQKILQFTATPYRRDGRLVDGKVIYEYPLRLAQQDRYFKKISFRSVYEIDERDADEAIAIAAVEQLRDDIGLGKDHLMMARCANIDRAQTVLTIYQRIASDLNPVIIHSEISDSEAAFEKIWSRQSRIIVCVNMLGEGFDLPQLKVAAVHDTHKSLAILLQFTGRFTRTGGENIGDATVIANIADQDVSSALERLYSEDADWNHLLCEFSSEAAKEHSQLIEFLNSSERLDQTEDDGKIEISHHLLRPTLSTLMYEATDFRPKKFFEGISKGVHVHRVWLHNESKTLYFITRLEPPIRWTRSRNLHDRIWDLYVLHFDPTHRLLYLSSSDKSSDHEGIAKAVGATRLISGDIIFRSLGNINRLVFQNVGVRKHGRRNLRYALYTGSDVAEALSISERAGSVKSNLNGVGWENGHLVTIGCSYKGRVWARMPGNIPELVKWCESVGNKIRDDSIDTREIIANVMIPEEVESLPDKAILSIEWPYELLKQSEERITLSKGEEEQSISMFDIDIVRADMLNSSVEFCLKSNSEESWANLIMTIGGEEGFKVLNTLETVIKIRVGNLEMPIEEYFSNYPPMIRFVDLSELDGNLLIRPQHTRDLVFPDERFEVWDWEGVDLTKESIWKKGVQREDSIQWRAANQFVEGNFDIVFDDDASGEAADLVCLKEEIDHIRLALVHCKFTKGQTAGERVKDVVEVSSQAIRSAKWKWKFKDLCRHVVEREKKLQDMTRLTRFLLGQASDINRFVKTSRFKEIRAEIIIVQPGLSRASHSADQTAVLAATDSYLKETIGVNLDVICSA